MDNIQEQRKSSLLIERIESKRDKSDDYDGHNTDTSTSDYSSNLDEDDKDPIFEIPEDMDILETSSSCSEEEDSSVIGEIQEEFEKSPIAPDCSQQADSKEQSQDSHKKIQQRYPQNPGKIKKKKRTVCTFCHDEVTNFARHLKRRHSDVKKVRDILQEPKKSRGRRISIGLVRNEGHFEEYLKGRTIPAYQRKSVEDSERRPCPYCKVLCTKQYLCRHVKNCPAAAISKDFKKGRHLSASQTMIACALDTENTLNKMRVKNEVFDTMRADKASMVAKTDILIRCVGEKYLKKQKRPQMARPCSNKMRELAKLLIQVREIEQNEKLELIDVIRPSMFDQVVEGAKRVGGYDPISKSYRAGSVSAHLGTTLKHVCEELTTLILKKSSIVKYGDPEAKLKEVKRFKELVTTQWTTEVSSLAFKDLNEKKWNKPTVLPLTKDIFKFKEHVTQTANKAAALLRNNLNDAREYKNLVNATLALTILYNRRRIGDVQYTKLDTYSKNFSSSNQEEVIKSLSESEKILTKHYKRVVTGGKGSKAIVILFPPNLQNFMNVIVDVRLKTNLVPQSNPYLFAHPGSESWIRGDVIIRNFAKNSDLEHPEHISSNRLRKQIATVLQILNLNPEEADQFALFMGHTGKTHEEYYRLTEDVYQTAKVSKLLILMDKGTGHEYKGKSLNEIDINPEVDLAESDDSEDDESTNIDHEASSSNVMPRSPEPSTSSAALPCKKKQTGRTPWTPEQIQVVKKYFNRHIQLKKPPKKQECEQLMENHPALFKNKDWVRVKTYVYNLYRDK